ncbi:hypothetical protein Sgleb_02340 [Streptomyces glebosus]|uniref:Major facilitator superfamily (MFS) profile domain-containing protein n=1 Tax=Streptomyces glebosus TaxID=249580 RepID=A0A640SLP7_9ACTN|nr:MFS transporter [Streptomyces glebosus]GFE12187.1 hypothetical protein Sgleb_02340 [Streptomyces glebosus]GHG72643.1 hypothetical protein GCM10010513_45640 [Streptomyces glebosus]
MPGSLALLQQAYPAPAERSRAFGLWGSMAGIAASAGPLLGGGLLVTTVGWRRVFFINLPVGCVCLLLTLRHVSASARRTDRPVDWPAQCALIATVALLTTVLNEAGRRGWTDPLILTGAGLCLLSAAAFVLRERLARTPVLPLRLLRSRPMSGAAAIGLLFNFAFYGMIFTASLYFQHHRGLTALRTGLALFPAVAMTMFASVLSGRPARRTGHRPLVVTGMLLGAAGLAGWAAAPIRTTCCRAGRLPAGRGGRFPGRAADEHGHRRGRVSDGCRARVLLCPAEGAPPGRRLTGGGPRRTACGDMPWYVPRAGRSRGER